jgi:hypothetical protein
MRKRILVDRSAVEHNHETGEKMPVFTVVEADGTKHHTCSILILGPCEVKYDPSGAAGSRIWIETFDRLVLQDATDTEALCPSLVAV